ncbi:MAG: hypothetical protein DI537_31095 [Stutzerimonas stutzeri]|nr:MAG: hypothetical protein DI537_31095 [Stutzerimonas stutzeri]
MDRPILFSAPMVRALLAGRKSQTRRIAKFIEAIDDGEFHIHNAGGGLYGVSEADVPADAVDYAPISIGDRLWVREAYSGPHRMGDIPPRHWRDDLPIWFWADGNPEYGDWTKPKPGIHMPRWASRLTLTVTDVRVQRLGDISETDAKAEGVDPIVDHGVGTTALHTIAFQQLWDRLHGEGATYANPWVAAYTFTVERRNIDALPSGADHG